MKKLAGTILNILFILLVVAIAVGISTLALTKKINNYTNQYRLGIEGAVVKKPIPIVSFSEGIVDKIYVKTGDEVKKGDLLVALSNPALEDQVKTLKKFPTNVSAQTQAKLGEQQLKELTITSPVDGIVGDISITEGAPADSLTKLLTLYSNSNIQLLTYLTIDQYQEVKKSSKIQAYSQRLNQNFQVVPGVINPNEKTPLQFEEKKVGLFFTFVNKAEAVSLLNNEDLFLKLNTVEKQKINKPIDFIVDLWNKILNQQ